MIPIVDLDDTLYDESSYVRSGFTAVAPLLADRVGGDPEAVADRLYLLAVEHGRGDTFDRLLTEHGIDDPVLVAACVDAYRTHSPRLQLFPGVQDLLSAWAVSPLYLVTDGDPGVQQRKIEALGIAHFFTGIYRTWQFGREAGKPAVTCFAMIRDREGCAWSDLVYIADDPAKDFVGLRALGARTIRVSTGRFGSVAAQAGFDADVRVDCVTDAPGVLAAWEREDEPPTLAP
jgi:putative hydrolase of the HAD superfamily